MNNPKQPTIFAINVLPGALDSVELPEGHIPISISGVLSIFHARALLDRVSADSEKSADNLKHANWLLLDAMSRTSIGEEEIEMLDQAVYDMTAKEDHI